jgi:sugar lactone lactonase YvrE
MISFLLVSSVAFGQTCSNATVVFGQLGSFTSTTGVGISAGSLSSPQGVASDGTGNVYVADMTNNRVLVYAPGSTTAFRVYGQPSFLTNTRNNGGISANTLNSPTGLAVDGASNLYIADTNNNRVLMYAPGSTTASRVYGQLGSFASVTGTGLNGVTSANSLFSPSGVAVDSASNVFIADTRNNRVLVYAPGSTTAFRVYGQLGSFTSGSANGGVSANSLIVPVGVAVDSASNLYVSDWFTSRVLVYAPGSTTAFRVYGQLGSFTSGTMNNGGISANSLNNPGAVTVDSASRVYIADCGNNRVLVYALGSTTAFRVIGQLGDFASNTANNGGISSHSLALPAGVTNALPAGVAIGGASLYVSDSTNNRVLGMPCYCPSNFFSADGFGPCSPCPAGQDAVAPASTSCASCVSGFFNPGQGQSCQNCLPGNFSNSLQGSTGCTPCPAGSFSGSAGALLASCTPCQAGTSSSVIGASSISTCVPCPPNFFSDTAGASTCTPCPSGSLSNVFGSTTCLSTSGGLPLAAIIGISIGAVVIGTAAAIVGGIFLYRRFTARHDDYTEMLTDEKGTGVFYKM